MDPGAVLHDLSVRLADNPSILEIRKANRWLEQSAPDVVAALRRVKVAVLTEQTVEGLREPLRLFARLAGFDVDLRLCPPYFPEMQLISPASELAEHQPELVFVLLDLEKRSAFTTVTPDERAFTEFATRMEETIGLMARFARRTGARIAVTSFVAIWPPLSLLRETDPAAGRVPFVQRANELLQARCAAAGVPVLPLASHLASWGHRRCIDVREYASSDTAFTPEGFNRVASLMVGHLREQLAPRRSLLIVDPEGALWGGPEAAYTPDNYPGRIFHRAMTWMKELSATGVRLALAGHAAPDRVLGILGREDFPLPADRFAAILLDDLPADEKVRRLLRELGAAPDQAVFLAADPEDCERVRRAFAGVAAVAVPDHLGEYLTALASIPGAGQRA